MRGMGGSRAQRAGAARHARGRWTSVLGQPRGACHIHRHAVLASCRGAAWCPHKSPDPHSSLWDGGTRRCAPAGRCPRAAILRCSCIVASSRTFCRCPLQHSCTAIPSCTHGCNAIRTIISTLCPRQDIRYAGRYDMLARNDETHVRDNGWVEQRGSQEL